MGKCRKGIHPTTPGLRCNQCKIEYGKRYRKEKEEQIKEYGKRRREITKEIRKIKNAEWWENNKENPKIINRRKKYKKENRELHNKYRRNRRKLIKLATPKWVDKQEIKNFYEKAKQLRETTGIYYVVDHIIPIKNEIVCGLHILSNLQIITLSENSKKHNDFKS